MSFDKSLGPVIDAFKARQPMRAKSLIVTLFGDVVSQHGRQIWLGSIASALDGLGVNDRLVRTSVFRLVKENWLDVERAGRKSFYRFTDTGSQEYQRAAQRIYSSDAEIWRGTWQLLMLVDVPEEKRDPLRRSLNWLGFRALTPGAYARPGGDEMAIQDLLDEFDLGEGIILMNALTSSITPKKQLRRTVSDSWNLDDLAEEYDALIKRFKPFRQSLDRGHSPSPEQAFQARLLLIHDYRRILLRDTPLPEDLLPNRWQGTLARQLVSGLYKDLADLSVDYISTQLQSEQGALPPPAGGFFQRFSH